MVDQRVGDAAAAAGPGNRSAEGWFGTGRDKPFQGLIARRGGEESFALDAIK